MSRRRRWTTEVKMPVTKSNAGFLMVHSPTRTCIACRERSPQSELVRLNISAEKVVIVAQPRFADGRSVYLCPREKCFDSLKKTGRIDFARGKYNRHTVRLEETEWYILKNKFMNFIRERGLGKAG